MNKKTLKEIMEISPTVKEYYDAKTVLEKYKSQPIYDKKFYVQMPFDFYAVGTFGGWDKNGNFMLKIEDVKPYYHIKDTHYVSTPIEYVFEKKQKNMKRLHAGVDYQR
jgi:hypothetical protein